MRLHLPQFLIELDQNVQRIAGEIRTPFFDTLMLFVTHLADHVQIIALTVALLALLWILKKRHHIIQVGLTLFITEVCVFSIKHIVARPRPETGLIVESGYSFPSGHATFSLLLSLLIFYTLKEHVSKKIFKYIIGVILVMCGLSAGLSRIYINVHYASDVIFGWLLALFVFGVSMLVYESHQRKIQKNNKE
jgi:undecaprenyl-diphosphatase